MDSTSDRRAAARGRQLLDVTAAATLWQERAHILADQLALAAPQQPVEASTVLESPAPATDAPVQHQINPGALLPWLFTALAIVVVLLVVR